MPEPVLTIHDDGAFDIAAGPVVLRRAYPALDHEALRPIGLDIRRDPGHERIGYRLAGGRALELSFCRDDGALVLRCELSGAAEAPRWIHPAAEACVEGARRCFRTGIGFSGPTGFVNLADLSTECGVDSWLFTALAAESRASLIVSTRDTRNYTQMCHIGNQVRRHNFRAREIAWNSLRFEAGFATERIPLPDGTLTLPALYFSAAPDTWTGLRKAALATGAALQARIPAPRVHYASWYNRGYHFNQQDLHALLEGLQREPEFLQTVEIDNIPDCWGDWIEPGRNFPGGIRTGIEEIQRAGYVPGVFFGPYMIGNRSRVAREHPEWLLRWNDGTLVTEWRNYGGTHDEEEVYVLDTSHPEARIWFLDLFRTLHAWGVRCFKTDFMEWGIKDSTRVRRHAPGKTSVQYFREDLEAIRERIGPESHWLGCITHFAPCIGLCDGMRVSSDVGVVWNDKQGGAGDDGTGGGTQNSVEETFYCQFFNNALWQNDPDNTYLRDYHIRLSEREIWALAFYYGILGVSINTSDDFHRLPPARLALWRFLRPQSTPWTASLPYVEGGSRFRVAVRAYDKPGAWAVVIVNDGKERFTERLTIRDWIGQDSATLFRWGPEGVAELGERKEWVAELESHESQLLYLSADGTPPPEGLTLGGHTNRRKQDV